MHVDEVKAAKGFFLHKKKKKSWKRNTKPVNLTLVPANRGNL